jgi:hypothetical protein
VTIERSVEGIPTLFSASQPNAAAFFGQEQFDWSLHYNLLFHPAGLVSPDPFFFCPFVHDYLDTQSNARTWYESALVEGLIIPFVRDRTVGGFYDLWKLMSQSSLQGHYGKGEKVAKRLDGLKGRATPDHWRPWPDGMGKRFGKLVDDRLSRDVESMIPANLRFQDAEKCFSYLRRTRPFRIDDIEVAKRSLPPEHGLRVSEILWASARRILGKDVKINNTEELLAIMTILPNITSQDVEDARQFYKTMQELYNENLSNSFDITRNYTDFDVMSRIFSAEGAVDLRTDTSIWPSPIYQDVELPPIPLLRTLSFDFVLAARNSREFAEYKEALANWGNNSRDQILADNITQAVKAYVGVIHRLCKQRPQNWDQCRVAVSHKPSLLRVAGQLVAFSSAVGGAYAIHEEVSHIAGYGMAFASVATSHAAGKVIDKGFEVAEHVGEHWLYISKIKRQKATLIAREGGSIEVHDQTKPRAVLQRSAPLGQFAH